MAELADINRSIEQMSVDEIAPIVQSALGDASASPVMGWAASPMSVESNGQGTLGFAHVSGMATTSAGNKLVEWSSVVKAVNPAEASLRGEDSFDTSEREIGLYRAGFLKNRTGGFQVVTCHSITRLGGTILLWLEDLSDAKSYPWGRTEFLAASRHLGHFNGSWPSDKAPNADWLDSELKTNHPLSAEFFRQSLRLLEHATTSPEAQRIMSVSGVLDISELHSGFAEISQVIRNLPMVICHNDSHSRNLFSKDDEKGETITYGADWASVGLGPVGVDAGTLAGAGLIYGESEAKLIAEIEPLLFAEYKRGLREVGYGVEEAGVRLGYLSNFVVYMVYCVVASMQQQEEGTAYRSFFRRFGVETEQMSEQLAARFRMFLPFFREAVSLARQIV